MIKLALSLFLAGSPVPSPNIVLVILDDVGVDRIGVYGDPLAHTPTMDALAAAGAWFLDAYSETVCSPSRLAMVSGTYPSRYGISNAIAYSGTDPASVPPLSIPTIARQLPAHYRREAIGKWHLANKSVGMVQPLLFGFDSHTGTIASPGNYTSWNWWHNGSFLLKLTDYLTTWNTDQAATSLMLWGDDHLFLWLAYQAPHKPFHAPPAHLHTYDLPPAVEDDPRLHFRAALEAFDTELGRLLDGLSPAVAGRTYVFVIGDNGTPVEAIDDGLQPEQSKGFVYEGGIHVPLIVAGPGIRPGSRPGLVHAVDIAPTVVELAGGDPSAFPDGQSFLGALFEDIPWTPRETAYWRRTSHNGPRDEEAFRGGTFKLVRDNVAGTLEMFDLATDPGETDDLVALPLPLPPDLAIVFSRLLYGIDNP